MSFAVTNLVLSWITVATTSQHNTSGGPRKNPGLKRPMGHATRCTNDVARTSVQYSSSIIVTTTYESDTGQTSVVEETSGAIEVYSYKINYCATYYSNVCRVFTYSNQFPDTTGSNTTGGAGATDLPSIKSSPRNRSKNTHRNLIPLLIMNIRYLHSKRTQWQPGN